MRFVSITFCSALLISLSGCDEPASPPEHGSADNRSTTDRDANRNERDPQQQDGGVSVDVGPGGVDVDVGHTDDQQRHEGGVDVDVGKKPDPPDHARPDRNEPDRDGGVDIDVGSSDGS